MNSPFIWLTERRKGLHSFETKTFPNRENSPLSHFPPFFPTPPRIKICVGCKHRVAVKHPAFLFQCNDGNLQQFFFVCTGYKKRRLFFPAFVEDNLLEKVSIYVCSCYSNFFNAGSCWLAYPKIRTRNRRESTVAGAATFEIQIF
jgi:hypothetical protein